MLYLYLFTENGDDKEIVIAADEAQARARWAASQGMTVDDIDPDTAIERLGPVQDGAVFRDI